MEIKRLDVEDFLFFLAYGIFLVFSILGLSFYYKYFNGLAYKGLMSLCIIILLFREVISELYTLKRLKSLLVSIVLMLLVWFNTQGATRSTLICMILLIYSARNISFYRIAKFSLWLSCLVGTFIVLSSCTGIIDDYVYISSRGRVRHYIGFRYSLYGSAVLFNIVSLVFYIYKDKLQWKYIVTLLFANFWIYRQTDSRTSFALSCLLLVLVIVKKTILPSGNLKRAFFYWTRIVFVVVLMISIYLTVSYSGKPWQQKLDTVLEKRISLASASYQKYGISFTGKDIHWVGNGLKANGESDVGTYSYVDNLYMHILQRYGIVFAVIVIFLFTRVMYRSFRRRDFDLMFILFLISLKSIIDDQALWLYYNTFLFIAGTCYLSERDIWNEKKNQLN